MCCVVLDKFCDLVHDDPCVSELEFLGDLVVCWVYVLLCKCELCCVCVCVCVCGKIRTLLCAIDPNRPLYSPAFRDTCNCLFRLAPHAMHSAS